MKMLFISVLVTINITIFLIAFFLKPLDPSMSYYIVWFWLALLASINWIFSSLVFFSNNSEKKSQAGTFFGILPSLNILILLYSIISFILILVFYNNLSNTFHLSLQTVSLGLTILISLFMGFALKGSQYSTNSIVSKSDLLNSLKKLETKFNDREVKDIILQMMNYISYQLVHPSKLNQEKLIEINIKLKDQKNEDIEEFKALFKFLKDM